MNGRQLDLTSEATPATSRDSSHGGPRRFLGIVFDCCRVYSAIYPNREGTAYVGNCPKCARPIKIGIGPGGSDTRFFRAF